MLSRRQQRYLDRLEKWAEALKKVPEESFDIYTECELTLDLDKTSSPIDKQYNKLIKETLRNGKPCGCAGCAVGYLPAIFPRSFEYRNEVVKPKYQFQLDELYLRDTFGPFFGLDQHSLCQIYEHQNYSEMKITPKVAAKRIMQERAKLKKKFEEENRYYKKKIMKRRNIEV